MDRSSTEWYDVNGYQRDETQWEQLNRQQEEEYWMRADLLQTLLLLLGKNYEF
jgi:hypothetical protein